METTVEQVYVVFGQSCEDDRYLEVVTKNEQAANNIIARFSEGTRLYKGEYHARPSFWVEEVLARYTKPRT